jgi:chromosome partitioning protein
MAKLFTAINQKGGDGKTTIVCNLILAAAEAGKTALVVDFDTQGNTSQVVSQDMTIRKRRGGAEQLFAGGEFKFLDTPHENVKLLNGHGYLDDLDTKEKSILETASELREKVRNLPFDYVFFDTPPSMGPRHVVPLLWSDLAIITLEPKLFSLSGLEDMFNVLEYVGSVNPSLSSRLVINKINRSSSTQSKAVESLREKFGKQIIAEFSQRVPVSDAIENFKPVWKFSKDKKLNQEWRSFAYRTLGLSA